MSRILVAECKQEISSFNPVIGTYDNFSVRRGPELFAYHQGRETELCGALQVFADSHVDVIPTYGAVAPSAGPLDQQDFERLAAELLAEVTPHLADADGMYFCLHGAMGCTQELDPEGYLLQEIRRSAGPDFPIVISQDLHGILTHRMLEHSNGLAIYHTYPHVDLADTGRRAAYLLLQVLAGAQPVVARVRVPALVRGNELITASGVYGETIRYCQALEEQPDILAAGMMIGNPFTDVPELCSQAIVAADADPDLARNEALYNSPLTSGNDAHSCSPISCRSKTPSPKPPNTAVRCYLPTRPTPPPRARPATAMSSSKPCAPTATPAKCSRRWWMRPPRTWPTTLG